jgi:hypothetical protein
MTPLLKTISLVALLATIVPSMLYLSGTLTHDLVKWIALAGTITWFVATPLWMGRGLDIDADQVQI